MPDFSLAEIALIVVVCIVFIGPKELPLVIRTVAKTLHSIRSLSKEILHTFEELGRESGLNDLAKDMKHDMRLIKGDDGKMYESFDSAHVSKLTATPPPKLILPDDPPPSEAPHDGK